MRMPFGKHKGLEIEELPDGYLMWLYEQAEIQSPYLKRSIEQEYHARFGSGAYQESFFGGSDRAGSDRASNSSGASFAPGALEKLAAEQPKLFLELAEAGYRTLAKRYHSDTGGTDEAMRQLNFLIEKVRQHVRSKQ